MLPLLECVRDGQDHQLKKVVPELATRFRLTELEMEETIPSGPQPLFYNRVAWAQTYLVKAGLLARSQRGVFKITARGLRVLKKPPASINIAFLKQFEEFNVSRSQSVDLGQSSLGVMTEVNSELTPQEALDVAFQTLQSGLADDLLSSLKSSNDKFFEYVVVEVLVKMGYGGNRVDAGKAIGRSGDEGIDGVIKEDHLGLDSIYIQAKRWESTIGRPEIQKFSGALDGQRARKGVFITTSDFTKEARAYAANIDKKIVLIDGMWLAKLMIEFNVGVVSVGTYEVKRLDSDYFGGT